MSILDQADGQWNWLITKLTSIPASKLHNKHQSCPVCGGNDRFRYDNKNGKGTWFCSHGDTHLSGKQAGTGFSLIMDMNNWTKAQTMKAIKNELSIADKPAPTPVTSTAVSTELVPIIPVPEHARPYDQKIYMPKSGKVITHAPQYNWEWRDEAGALIGYVNRYTLKDGKKMVLQVAWTDEHGWTQVAIKNKPPFGAETLSEGEAVLIVEGEKSQSIMRKLLKMPVICAQGGSQMVNSTNWSGLAGKRVYISPDSDDAGEKYTHNLIQSLTGIAQSIYVVNHHESIKASEDLSDVVVREKWSKKQTLTYIKDHNILVYPEPTEITKEHGQDILADMLRPLGHHGGSCYYCPSELKYLLCLSASEHNAKNLMLMVPLYIWQLLFPSKQGVDWNKAINHCLTLCKNKGIFNPAMVRGLGLWRDGQRIVLNTGSQLIVNGARIDHLSIESKYSYEQQNYPAWYDDQQMLSSSEKQLIVTATESVSWANPAYAVLAQGLLVGGPICGYPNWRSSGWIIGSAGTGKTTIMRELFGNLWAQFCLKVQGASTEAGIRQRLGSDAIPVLFDEAEANETGDEIRIQKILELMRQASSEHESVIAKGTKDHSGAAFAIRSTFMFSSINTALKQKADETRVIVLELRQESDPAIATYNYGEFKRCVGAFNQDFSARFMTTIITSILKIESRANRAIEILSAANLTKRMADLYGWVLAQASILHERIVFDDFVLSYVDAIVEMQNTVTESTQEQDLFDGLMQHIITVPMVHGSEAMPLFKAIELASLQFSLDSNLDPIKLKSFLLAYGIRLDPKQKIVWIANKNTNLQKILKRTTWHNELKRNNGALVSEQSLRFGTTVSRAVGFPFELFKSFYD